MKHNDSQCHLQHYGHQCHSTRNYAAREWGLTSPALVQVQTSSTRWLSSSAEPKRSFLGHEALSLECLPVSQYRLRFTVSSCCQLITSQSRDRECFTSVTPGSVSPLACPTQQKKNKEWQDFRLWHLAFLWKLIRKGLPGVVENGPGLSSDLSHRSRDKVKKLSEARESVSLKDCLGNGFLHPGPQACELLRLSLQGIKDYSVPAMPKGKNHIITSETN